MTILAGLSAPLVRTNYLRNETNIAEIIIAQNIRRAQLLAIANNLQSDWGVHVGDGQVVLFKGSSYSSRDTSYDEVSDIASSISTSGVNEIVFDNEDGRPVSTGTITLNDAIGQSRDLNVNSLGVVEY